MLKSLKLLSDPTRLRILMLVGTEALSVAELQEILGMGQSRISTQLSQLKTAGLVTDDGARVKEQLLSGKPSPLVYDTQGTPPEIIEEDKVIESWPLKINVEKLKIVPAEELFEQ